MEEPQHRAREVEAEVERVAASGAGGGGERESCGESVGRSEWHTCARSAAAEAHYATLEATTERCWL